MEKSRKHEIGYKLFRKHLMRQSIFFYLDKGLDSVAEEIGVSTQEVKELLREAINDELENK